MDDDFRPASCTLERSHACHFYRRRRTRVCRIFDYLFLCSVCELACPLNGGPQYCNACLRSTAEARGHAFLPSGESIVAVLGQPPRTSGRGQRRCREVRRRSEWGARSARADAAGNDHRTVDGNRSRHRNRSHARTCTGAEGLPYRDAVVSRAGSASTIAAAARTRGTHLACVVCAPAPDSRWHRVHIDGLRQTSGAIIMAHCGARTLLRIACPALPGARGAVRDNGATVWGASRSRAARRQDPEARDAAGRACSVSAMGGTTARLERPGHVRVGDAWMNVVMNGASGGGLRGASLHDVGRSRCGVGGRRRLSYCPMRRRRGHRGELWGQPALPAAWFQAAHAYLHFAQRDGILCIAPRRWTRMRVKSKDRGFPCDPQWMI
jgi:hypothetical protein